MKRHVPDGKKTQGPRRRGGGLSVLAAALALHMPAATAWAQRTARLAEEQGGVQWGIWGVALVVAIIVCLPAFVSIRRPQK